MLDRNLEFFILEFWTVLWNFALTILLGYRFTVLRFYCLNFQSVLKFHCAKRKILYLGLF